MLSHLSFASSKPRQCLHACFLQPRRGIQNHPPDLNQTHELSVAIKLQQEVCFNILCANFLSATEIGQVDDKGRLCKRRTSTA